MINETIYVRLINEGIDVWRPVFAKRGPEPNYFHILSASQNNKSTEEEWEFPPESHVFAKETSLEGQRVLLAYALVGN